MDDNVVLRQGYIVVRLFHGSQLRSENFMATMQKLDSHSPRKCEFELRKLNLDKIIGILVAYETSGTDSDPVPVGWASCARLRDIIQMTHLCTVSSTVHCAGVALLRAVSIVARSYGKTKVGWIALDDLFYNRVLEDDRNSIAFEVGTDTLFDKASKALTSCLQKYTRDASSAPTQQGKGLSKPVNIDRRDSGTRTMSANIPNTHIYSFNYSPDEQIQDMLRRLGVSSDFLHGQIAVNTSTGEPVAAVVQKQSGNLVSYGNTKVCERLVRNMQEGNATPFFDSRPPHQAPVGPAPARPPSRGFASALGRLGVESTTTVHGHLVRNGGREIRLGDRGGLYYTRTNPFTGKETRVYLKRYQRDQCERGDLLEAGHVCGAVRRRAGFREYDYGGWESYAPTERRP